jgi:hypothetical protein
MIYQKGTEEDFNNWHDIVKQQLGIPNTRTTAYSQFIKHPEWPTNQIGVWVVGDYADEQKETFTYSQVRELGYFPVLEN